MVFNFTFKNLELAIHTTNYLVVVLYRLYLKDMAIE